MHSAQSRQEGSLTGYFWQQDQVMIRWKYTYFSGRLSYANEIQLLSPSVPKKLHKEVRLTFKGHRWIICFVFCILSD